MVQLITPTTYEQNLDRYNVTIQELSALLMATEKPSDCTKPKEYVISDPNERALLKATLIGCVRQVYGMLHPIGIMPNDPASEMGHWTANRTRMASAEKSGEGRTVIDHNINVNGSEARLRFVMPDKKVVSTPVYTSDDLSELTDYYTKNPFVFRTNPQLLLWNWLDEKAKGKKDEQSSKEADGAHLDYWVLLRNFCAYGSERWFRLTPFKGGYKQEFYTGHSQFKVHAFDEKILSIEEVNRIREGSSTEYIARLIDEEQISPEPLNDYVKQHEFCLYDSTIYEWLYFQAAGIGYTYRLARGNQLEDKYISKSEVRHIQDGSSKVFYARLKRDFR